jgi:hypothetical protein
MMNMKIFLFAGIMAMFVMSCNDESQPLTDITQLVDIETVDTNTKVSVEEAKQNVLTVLNDLDCALAINGSVSVRSGSNFDNSLKIKDIHAFRVRNKENIQAFAKDAGLTESIDTLMYIVNFEDNQGYAIVAADNRTDNVYAIIDQGMLSADSLEYCDNPGFMIFMEDAAYKILTDMKKNIGKPKKDNPVTYAANPGFAAFATIRLYTRWNQRAPYNWFCPSDGGQQCPTGCVTTAVAQILSYFKTIGSVQWSFNGTYGSAVLNWSSIESDCTNNYGMVTTNSASAIEVAHLMRYLGIAMNADYSANSTEISEDNGVEWMNNWGGLSATSLSSYDGNKIVSALAPDLTLSKKLVYMRANSGKKKILGITVGYTGGHAWVIDGCFFTAQKRYFHCNFGWGGVADGFYLDDVFDATAGPEYITGDDPGNAGSSNFRYRKEISIVSQ